MPTLPQRKLLAAILAVAALLALPAAANATLSYTKDFKQPTIFYANDNGSNAHKVGPGYNSRVSPDGDQMDLVEVMEIEDGLIKRHRVYWGWYALNVLQEGHQ